MVKSLDEVIERLQYKADNIKAKLEPSYFTECIDYLKSLPRVEEQEIRNKAIDEFRNALHNSPNMHIWACRDMALEFCDGDHCDECENKFMEELYQIAEQMKGE
jgi:hypothetical protein